MDKEELTLEEAVNIVRSLIVFGRVWTMNDYLLKVTEALYIVMNEYKRMEELNTHVCLNCINYNHTLNSCNSKKFIQNTEPIYPDFYCKDWSEK